MGKRYQEYGNSVYHQEPNVKEGCGGLRDLQTALWIGQARFGIQTIQELQHQGILSETEREEVETAFRLSLASTKSSPLYKLERNGIA